jgi:hypothetical protein
MTSEPYIINDIPTSELKKMKAFRDRIEAPPIPDLTERSVIEKWPHSLPEGVEVRHCNTRLMWNRFNGPKWKYWRDFYDNV